MNHAGRRKVNRHRQLSERLLDDCVLREQFDWVACAPIVDK